MISTKQNGYQPVRNEDFTPPRTGSNAGFEHFHKWELLRLCKRYHKNIYKLIGQKMALKDKVAELERQIEKMKCCENCKYNSYWGDELHCNYGLKEALQEDKLVECKDMDKWEIKDDRRTDKDK